MTSVRVSYVYIYGHVPAPTNCLYWFRWRRSSLRGAAGTASTSTPCPPLRCGRRRNSPRSETGA